MSQNSITAKLHPEMIRAMFDCGKKQTSRFNRLGNPGDTITLTHPETDEQRSWIITGIPQHTLGHIAMHMYRQEGFISESDFMQFWAKIYPTKCSAELLLDVHLLKEAK